MSDRWGIEGPPPEAYTRVTNPERFQPLHSFTEGLVARLEARFDVERTEGYGPGRRDRTNGDQLADDPIGPEEPADLSRGSSRLAGSPVW
jgi:hypothetical protein